MLSFPATARPSTRFATHSDDELLQLTRDGDSQAFGTLFERLEPEAKRYARRLVPDHAVDDVVAECFAAVLSAIRRGRGPQTQPLKYVMYTIRTTAWRDRRSVAHELDKATRLHHPTAHRVEALAPLDEDLGAAFRTLSPRYQQVIWWAEIEGWTAAEIGVELGMTSGAAAALGYRARQALRRAYLTHAANHAA